MLYGRKEALKKVIEKRNILQTCKKTIRGINMMLHTKDGCGRRLWYYKNIDNKFKKYPRNLMLLLTIWGMVCLIHITPLISRRENKDKLDSF